MGVSLFRRSPSPSAVVSPDAAAEELRSRLRSMHDHCLTNLVAGLDAMNRGDLTYHVAPATQPISSRSENPETQELVDLFNSMLAKAQTALEGYNGVRETMRSALGDQSCLDGLQERLTSLSEHCLTGLGDGLGAMAQGDLTVTVHPATTPLESARGENLGSLGETFNTMLGQAQGGLELYNATRESVAQIISRHQRDRRARLRRLAGDVRHHDRDRRGDRGHRAPVRRRRRGRRAPDAEHRGRGVHQPRSRRARRSRRPARRPGRRADHADLGHRRPDQPAGAQRRDRGRPRGRDRPRLRRRRRRGAQARRVLQRHASARPRPRSTACRESITSVSACIERMSEATINVGQIAREAGAATSDVSAATEQSSAATQQIAASSSDLAEMATSRGSWDVPPQCPRLSLTPTGRLAALTAAGDVSPTPGMRWNPGTQPRRSCPLCVTNLRRAHRCTARRSGGAHARGGAGVEALARLFDALAVRQRPRARAPSAAAPSSRRAARARTRRAAAPRRGRGAAAARRAPSRAGSASAPSRRSARDPRAARGSGACRRRARAARRPTTSSSAARSSRGSAVPSACARRPAGCARDRPTVACVHACAPLSLSPSARSARETRSRAAFWVQPRAPATSS